MEAETGELEAEDQVFPYLDTEKKEWFLAAAANNVTALAIIDIYLATDIYNIYCARTRPCPGWWRPRPACSPWRTPTPATPRCTGQPRWILL